MSELINRWFSRTPRLPGMSACGMVHAEGAAFSKSWDEQYSDTVLNALWPKLAAIVDTAESRAAETLQWTFDGCVILGVPRQNGLMFFVLLSNKTGERDNAGVERLLAEFRSLRG